MRSRSIVLISCVKRKHPYRAKAKELYDSTLFRAQRAYAERFGDQWFILSARHGLLDPECEIDSYEETLKDASSKQKRDWSERVYSDLQRHTQPDDKITITAGEDYCRYLVPLLVKRGHEVRRPVKGLRMGFIPGRLRELIAGTSSQGPSQTAQTIPVYEIKLEHAENHNSAPTIHSIPNAGRSIERFYEALSYLRERSRTPQRLMI